MALPIVVNTVSKVSVSVENDSLSSGFVEKTSSLHDEKTTESIANIIIAIEL